MKSLVLGTVVGGIILFAWGMFSWCVLPWHNPTMNKFSSEELVEAVLKTQVQKPGIYMLPNGHTGVKGLPKEQRKAIKKETMEQMAKGPLAFVAFQPNGVGPMSMMMVRSAGIQLAVAFLLTWLLGRTQIKNYFGKISFVVGLALLASIIAYLPSWNWMGFSAIYTLVNMADILIAWPLAGLAIAKFVD